MITNLRKAGKLDEAYKMANQNLQANPTDIWNIRNMAWVLYDFAKREATITTKERFIRCVEKIISLDVSADEDIYYQSVGFLIRAMAATLIRANDDDCQYFDTLSNCIKRLKIKPQTPAFSSIIQTFLRTKMWWTGFADFCRWWGFNSFQNADYLPSQTDDGKKIMPLAERVYMAYAKCLLDGGTTNDITTFLPQLQQTAKVHQNYIYLPFYEAKLMLKIGRKEEFFVLMKKFAHRKSGEFWVWDLLGDYFDDDNTRLKFYAKALCCPSKPEMSVKLREKTALLLCKLGFRAEALAELHFIIKIRERNKWNITHLITQKVNEMEAQGIVATQNNKAFYANMSAEAEKYIFGETKQQSRFEGKINITNGGFGFVRYNKMYIFVPAKLLSNNNIQNGTFVSGQCIVSFDKKKNRDGFVAIKINSNS